MEYNFIEIEKKWRDHWRNQKIYKTEIDHSKPKFYVLDMFPYPSGAGLHVGHPLGYIASDIYSRYKKQKGFNVLHPMGYDAFGLPAEQYAIQTGTHPAVTTMENIARYREQMDKIGFSYDWERSFKTCDPDYYKWTQWTFIQLFNSYYCYDEQQARPIKELEEVFAQQGNKDLNIAQTEELHFTAKEWNEYDEEAKQRVLLNYRLAYLADTWVNWCPKLGTVLANDEVVRGVSVRGGHKVERKLMKQWMLRVSAYAERLLQGLEKINWSDSLKDIQRNWIGKSEGAFIRFPIEGREETLDVFTTRPDTIFGVSFMVLFPEHDLIQKITTPEQKQEIDAYMKWTASRSETERQSEVKKVSGAFTGAYAIHPFTGEKIPIWIAEYVLAGYGTGAIMAVPAHDSRDYAFAKHFNMPIKEVIAGGDISEEAFESKEGICVNSDFINGMNVKEGGRVVIQKVVDMQIGYATINYRLRDAIFSRQRYWGEPFPVYYKNGLPYMIPESELPLELPEIDKFLPTEDGEPPLARAKNWHTREGYEYETSTMPGFAGSSAYYLRYMDPHNNDEYFSKESNEYWQNVDIYVGGSEHATGHLIYSRFWNKFLYDLGLCVKDEPFEKLINQGMILAYSQFVYRILGENRYVSYGLKDQYDTTPIHVHVDLVHNGVLDTEAFKVWQPEFANAEFILEDGKYRCGSEVEKMSKSKYNVQNPDDLVEKYGADTLRMYEMFLGPLELSKPWDTNGIEGVYRFIRKFWKLFFDRDNNLVISDGEPTADEYKVLHKTIKKIEEDNERFSFNTGVSTFMICVNDLTEKRCNKRKILEPLVVLLSAYAPHISEELWSLLGNQESVYFATFPQYEEKYLIESEHNYPVSFNGKTRFQRAFPLDMQPKEIEGAILQDAETQKWLDGKTPKKVIVVPGKIINIVF
ncbi:leucine--tRNA ligase [Bacteroidales bacterium OttesenSCG-928-B11]|nr:leucine--tRNA ligase [Bacteroidales bacterium OttesenSCG-928-B11]MDL2325903.1 leucine--tRNA ligase [Bacteroidales bacterium OttesenSCG-928-A14]